MTLNFSEWLRLGRVEQSVEHLRKAASTPNPFAPKQADIEDLQAEVGQLRLLVAVLYRLVLSKGVASEAEIHQLLAEFDAADGKRDGGFDGDPVSGAAIVKAESPEDDNPFPKIRVP